MIRRFFYTSICHQEKYEIDNLEKSFQFAQI